MNSIFTFLRRMFYGGSFAVYHIGTDTRKVFWCDTWQDAIEWVICALNDDMVRIVRYDGAILAQRG